MQIDLTRLFEVYGIKGLVISLIILFLGSIIKTSWFSKLWIKIGDKIIEFFLKRKTKEEISTIEEGDILNHDIFNYIDLWMYSKIPTFQFSSEYRTVVFRKYLTIYVNAYKKGLSDFVKSGQYETMTQAELWKSLLDMINNIIYSYEKEARDSGIPEIIINKMKSKNNDTIQLTIDLVGSISNSHFHLSDNNLLKMYSILNILLSVLENTITCSEDVCNSINGQLKGLIMDGKKEP